MGPAPAIQLKAKPLTSREIRASIRIVVDACSSSRATGGTDGAHSPTAP